MADVVDDQGYDSEQSYAPSTSDIDQEDLVSSDEDSNVSVSGARKRRQVFPEVSSKRACRRPGPHNDQYRQLLNADILDASANSAWEEEPLPPSQIGASLWSSAEKERFFNTLSRVGKSNIDSIAAAVRTKSCYEVQQYLLILDDALRNHNADTDGELLNSNKMPAATDISGDCCDELEMAGEALSLRQDEYEETLEKQKWGEFWLLDPETIDKIERRLATDAGRRRLGDLLPAAQLLEMKTFLELSRRIFMNPARPDDSNWQFIANEDEEPNLQTTAFLDFYHVVVSLTRKLIAVSQFITTSRSRASDAKSTSRFIMVKPKDVSTAIKLLRLPETSSQFWRACPRRCNLDIYDRSDTGARFLQYDQVERDLDASSLLLPADSRKHPDATFVAHDVGEEEAFEEDVGDYLSSDEEKSHIYDTDVEVKDARRSLQDEVRLWGVLRRSPPPSCNPENIPDSDTGDGSTKAEKPEKDWRDFTSYKSVWETISITTASASLKVKPTGLDVVEATSGEEISTEYPDTDTQMAEFNDRTADESSNFEGDKIEWEEEDVDTDDAASTEG